MRTGHDFILFEFIINFQKINIKNKFRVKKT
jgi:hypothetical protein